jgi:hypothetical protein
MHCVSPSDSEDIMNSTQDAEALVKIRLLVSHPSLSSPLHDGIRDICRFSQLPSLFLRRMGKNLMYTVSLIPGR